MKKFLKSYLQYIFLFVFFLFIFSIYYQRVGSFSFGDEWHNFVVAYFMSKGHVLHNEIFHNHQMLTPYISYFIQTNFSPDNLYQLVLFHRTFVFLFSVLMSFLLVYRFGLRTLGFVVFYELTKYYLFGNLFLPESLAVYPIVYLLNLAYERVRKKEIFFWDYIFAAIVSWIIIFLREPYIPIVFILYGTFLIGRKISRSAIVSLLTFGIFSLITLFSVNINEYVNQVIAFNLQYTIPSEVNSSRLGGLGLLISFFYPIYILFFGERNYFRGVEILLSSSFILLSLFFIYFLQFKKVVVLLVIILGIAALRFTQPGKMFFEAFHMNVWYGLLIMCVFLLTFEVYIRYTSLRRIIVVFSILIFIYPFLPSSFIWEKVDKEREFTINYAHYHTIGETIKILSDKDDKLFTDQWDYLLYWVSGLDSSYKYSIYTFVMSNDPKYKDKREEMLNVNPPDFYYTYCTKDVLESPYLSSEISSLYVQLLKNGKPSCLYIKKEKLEKIKKDRWKEVKRFGFSET